MPGSKHRSLRFAGIGLGLCAQRLWEHIELQQVNPFATVTPRSARCPECYVDVVDTSGPFPQLTGLVLSDLMRGESRGLPRGSVRQLLRFARCRRAVDWLATVRRVLERFAARRFVRHKPAPFLPSSDRSPLGIDGLDCALGNWLETRAGEKATVDQWIRRIANLANSGLRKDEMEHCLRWNLSGSDSRTVSGRDIAACLDYGPLRLSIVPVVRYASKHLSFSGVPANTPVERRKPKLRGNVTNHPQFFDRVLGYWIDILEWDDLLGRQRGWMALDDRGAPVVSADKPSGLCATKSEAVALANIDAKTRFPRLTAEGLWSRHRPTGGAQYREWLVTLPRYSPAYFSRHFPHRNVIAHIRCDLREGVNDRRILTLQEVQSDWAQNAKREARDGDAGVSAIPSPPWLQEWPALALKLCLLHACRLGADALAWTPGADQIARSGPLVLGADWLENLYDRRLPADLNRILRPCGRQCETIDVFHPTNFFIEPFENGYEVRDENRDLLGRCATWDDARDLVPDGAHETLKEMWGVSLDDSLRKRILEHGFYAWGAGIR